ncbi:unnamed protein product [Protopolystoma xenopodis]|uniref:Uncharacterized protein n=1 Tax=Protopolystoma xenopodis TaxID=117903 RepID=A0A3S4ZUC4_9PLAT|nr:unnamed protein product [Protopolystoma xenopodis]
MAGEKGPTLDGINGSDGSCESGTEEYEEPDDGHIRKGDRIRGKACQSAGSGLLYAPVCLSVVVYLDRVHQSPLARLPHEPHLLRSRLERHAWSRLPECPEFESGREDGEERMRWCETGSLDGDTP